ncbi:MAG: pirin [Gammaproteobacteria bacterium]|nr:pirin [Gammaproteobacteria bacterium]
MNRQNLDKFITEVLAIEAEEAKQANALGYMARALVQATMPHSKIEGSEFKRRNGAFRLTILADSEVGLPYGSIPRLLIAWATTEAVIKKERELILGNSLSEFMIDLGLMPTGGRWGTITRLREQMKKLFSSSISCTYDDGEHWAIKNIQPVTKADLWWDPKSPNQASLFQSTLTLGEEFFNEVINHPVPIDMRALKILKRSPLALDIYCWLTYRMSYLKKSTVIPWVALQVQFGSNYADDAQGTRNFKRHFIDELRKVACIYTELKVESAEHGLTIKPSKPHVPLLNT